LTYSGHAHTRSRTSRFNIRYQIWGSYDSVSLSLFLLLQLSFVAVYSLFLFLCVPYIKTRLQGYCQGRLPFVTKRKKESAGFEIRLSGKKERIVQLMGYGDTCVLKALNRWYSGTKEAKSAAFDVLTVKCEVTNVQTLFGDSMDLGIDKIALGTK
jgi:hypothetical protein